MKKIKNIIKTSVSSYYTHNDIFKVFFIALPLFTTSISFSSAKNDSVLPFDKAGNTAMHIATLNNDVPTINALALAHPEEVNRPTGFCSLQNKSFLNSPLHLAAYHGKWKAFSALVSLGANLNARNASNEIPVQNVLKKEQADYEKALEKGLLLRSIQPNSKKISIETQTTQDELLKKNDQASQKTTNLTTVAIQTEIKKTDQETMTHYDSRVAPPSFSDALPSYKQTLLQYAIARKLNPDAIPYSPIPRKDIEHQSFWHPENNNPVVIEFPKNYSFPDLDRELSKLLD